MKYPLTFYASRFVSTGSAASTRFWLIPVIFIQPAYRDDEGLYQHELVHVKQWAFVTLVSALLIAAVYLPAMGLALGIHAGLYMWVPRYRLICEVQAYKKQLRYYPDDRAKMFGRFIANSYGLTIHEAEAEMLLRQ